jgi:hypothetical protein
MLGMVKSAENPMNRATRILAFLTCLALAACNGTALVTLTATPSGATNFLAYRVTLDSIALQQSSGGSTQNVLPGPLSMDLAQDTGVSEILSAATIKKGTYTSAVVTIDYTNAVIIADDGSLNGVALTPQNSSAESIGKVTLTLNFDPANPLSISKNSTSQVALDFRLSATSSVNLSAHTVTITPLMIASSVAIDSKPLRLRGLLSSVDTTNSVYTSGITPFDGLVSESGSVQVVPTTTSTLYEVNGVAGTGSTGFTALAGLGTGAWTVAYGTLVSTTNTTFSSTPVTTPTEDDTSTSGDIFGTTPSTATTTDTTIGTTSTTTTDVSFSPTQVFAGTSVQGGFDRIAGIVAARTDTSLTVPTATLITSAGVEYYVSGAATITLGAGTAVTVPGQTGLASNTEQMISVGSWIDAYGTVTGNGGGNVAMDVTAGRVRLENNVASGTFTSAGTDSAGTAQVTIQLATLSGRLITPFLFVNTQPASFQVSTSALDTSGLIASGPAEFTGLVSPFGETSPDFTAISVADPTTISAELVLDFGSGGSATPFATLSSDEMDIPLAGTGAGSRHQIFIGAFTVQVPAQPGDLLIEPSTAATQVYAIAHASTSTVENFNTFADFITALQTELNGTTVATTITAEGIYTLAGNTIASTSVTIYLNI